MMPNINAIAAEVVNELGCMVSQPCYVAPRTLSFTWLTTTALKAEATTRDTNNHLIQVAYGVTSTAYEDASLLYTLCTTHLLLDQYDVLFAELDYGNGPKSVLPPDLDPVSARLTFFRSWIAWIYLHEQAHLFQGHGSVFANRTGEAVPVGNSEWMDPKNEPPLTGEAAWIRHCLELSADHEASVHAVGYALVQDKGDLRRSSLWMLVAAITCLFHHFYGEAREPQLDVAVGKHPDPAFRAALAMNAIRLTIWHPDVRRYVPWAETPEDVERVMRHAFVAASVYMQLMHFDPTQFPQFLTRMNEVTPERTAYEAGLKAMWETPRPEILALHFGPQPENAAIALE